MNIVEMLTQQLSGEVGKKLGGMAGLSEQDFSKALGAGLPGLLSGLGSLASNEQGAGKIAEAIRGMDSGVLGNLTGMLGGGALQKGGGALGNLLGGGIVDGLAGAISKATGLNASIVKTILGYLAPLVLSAIGASFQGGKVDASSVSRLFADQNKNIASALPSGMNLGSIPGFNALSSGGSKSSPSPAPAGSDESGLGRFLVPLLLLAIVGVGAFYYFRPTTPTEKENTSPPAEGALSTLQNAAADAADKTKGLIDGAKEKIENAMPNANLLSVKDRLDELLGSVGTELNKITDSASAEASLPTLKNSVLKLESFSATMGMVPAEGKAVINGFVKTQLEKLNPMIEKISSIPGLGDTVKQVIEQLKTALAKFTS